MAPREAEDNACAKFWGDKQRALILWYVMVFSGVVNSFFYIIKIYSENFSTVEFLVCLTGLIFSPKNFSSVRIS